MVNEGSDIGSKKFDARVKNLYWSKSAALMKSFDECQDLIPVPYLLFNAGKVGQEQF